MTTSTRDLYRHSLSLLTDLYQLTMAYGFWKNGLQDREAVFHLFFRKNPFKGGYAIACGVAHALDYLRDLSFGEDELDYLATLTGNDDKPLFERGFLDHLRDTPLALDVEAVEEGTVVFPHEPLMRIQGPLIQAQLVETALLNLVNFQTLVATKAARVCEAAGGDPVLEFGLRRAQGVDGALAASRAAWVGGAAATSNVLAGKLYGIPVKGTHAHSWVMTFGDEDEAFEAYAAAMPNNCVFLVDTYDTVEGVRKAVEVGKRLRERGHEMVGVRLDSGDLAYLSVQAREVLDAGGFPDARIVASNDLDEYVIRSLKAQGAKIAVWGVGTKLATCYDQPALGGVYKLAAIRAPGEEWQPRVKLSEQAIKVSNPGRLKVRRYYVDEGFQGDLIYDEGLGAGDQPVMVDPADPTRRKRLDPQGSYEDLLVPMLKGGAAVYADPGLDAARARAKAQLARFHAGIRRFENPHQYPVGLERRLHDLKTKLILEARGFDE